MTTQKNALLTYLRSLRARTSGPWNTLREPRVGVMLHWDGSKTDLGSISWLMRDDIKAIYHFLILRNGTIVQLAPYNSRAWHAGHCRKSPSFPVEYTDANSAFIGVAFSNNGTEPLTVPQMVHGKQLVQQILNKEGFGWERTTQHWQQAWPRGRKPDLKGVLDTDALRDYDIAANMPAFWEAMRTLK